MPIEIISIAEPAIYLPQEIKVFAGIKCPPVFLAEISISAD